MTAKPSQDPARKYLRLVFRQIPGAIWATDRDLRFTYVLGGTPMLEAAASERLVGQRVYEFVGTREPTEPVVAHHLAALAGTPQAFEYERRNRLFEVLIEPLIDETSAIVGCVGAAVDVTDRRGEQRRLRQSEARLAEAQRVAHVGSFDWELSSDNVSWSTELQRIYGVAPTAEVTPFDALLQAVHPDDRQRVQEAAFAAVRQPKPFVYAHRICRPDGEVRVLHIAGDVVCDPAGTPMRVVGSSWDITEQYETTHQLQQSVSLLEATLDATADGILVIDAHGVVTAHNQRFTEMWRVSPAMLAGACTAEDLRVFVADQLESPASIHDAGREIDADPERELFDTLRFSDGRVFERHSKPQKIGERVAGRVWSFRDVTARERLLQRATFLSDATRLLASLDVVQALDGVARLAVPVLGDQCVIDLLGGEAPHRLRGTLDDALPAPELNPVALGGHPCVYTVWSRSAVAVPLVCRDLVVGVVTLIAPAAREYSRADVAFVEELARRMALSLDNARLFEGARDALSSRDEFLSIAAHEIRGPLTAIHLAVQSLMREHVSPKAGRIALEVIQREDRRLGRFVDDLLDLGRLRTGQLHLTLQQVDIGTVVREVVSRMAADCAQAGCTVTVTTSGSLVGHWDPVRLEQVLANLLSNAIKFGRGKPIEITASRQGPRVRVDVTDHGIGIPPEMLTRIFDRFERAVEARHYGGLGLGLHIAKTIIEGLNGALSVESRPGEGATFIIELPTLELTHVKQIDYGRGR